MAISSCRLEFIFGPMFVDLSNVEKPIGNIPERLFDLGIHQTPILSLNSMENILTVDNRSCGCDGFTDGVSRAARVSSGVFGISVHDVEGDETETVGLDETRTSLDGCIVVEPLDFHRCVGHGNESTLEMGALSFLDLHALQRTREYRRLGSRLLGNLVPVILRSVLQIVNLLETDFILGVRENLRGRAATESAADFVAADEVHSATGVSAGILGYKVNNVEGDVAEIVNGTEAVS